MGREVNGEPQAPAERGSPNPQPGGTLVGAEALQKASPRTTRLWLGHADPTQTGAMSRSPAKVFHTLGAHCLAADSEIRAPFQAPAPTNGFSSRSRPIVVSSPCPGKTTVLSGSGQRWVSMPVASCSKE